MKKFLFIGLLVAVVLILVGGGGVVYAAVRNGGNDQVIVAQTPQGRDKVVPFGYGNGGMMNGYGYGPGGMMGGRGTRIERGAGFMHEYMISAFASAVGLTVDQVNTRVQNGETLTQIANAQGFTGDKLTQLVTQIRQAALDQAVAAGVITQAQADLMLERMKNYSGQGFGPGFGLDNCPMWDGDEVQP